METQKQMGSCNLKCVILFYLFSAFVSIDISHKFKTRLKKHLLALYVRNVFQVSIYYKYHVLIKVWWDKDMNAGSLDEYRQFGK